MRGQSKLKDKRQNLFGPTDPHDFCGWAKQLIKSDSHGRMFSSALQLISQCPQLESLTEKKVFATDRKEGCDQWSRRRS